jgi:hypothetical protein
VGAYQKMKPLHMSCVKMILALSDSRNVYRTCQYTSMDNFPFLKWVLPLAQCVSRKFFWYALNLRAYQKKTRLCAFQWLKASTLVHESDCMVLHDIDAHHVHQNYFMKGVKWVSYVLPSSHMYIYWGSGSSWSRVRKCILVLFLSLHCVLLTKNMLFCMIVPMCGKIPEKCSVHGFHSTYVCFSFCPLHPLPSPSPFMCACF